ncbi:hypothetical protein ACOSQ2_007105 [Xanthoceras sorbifolium]
MADNDVVLTDDVEKDLESNNMKETNNINSGDPLFLHNSDHPGMALVTTPLTRKNFLTWSRSVKIALGAKLKLNFIDESYKVPNKDSPLYDQWTRVNCMITL